MKPYEKYVPSGVAWIGDIPDGWEVKKLKYVSAVNQRALSEATQQDYEFRYVDIGSVTLEDGINEYTQMFFEDAPSRARRVVEKGDTIVSTVRTYLKAIAKIEDDNDVIVSTGFAVINPQKVRPDFFSFSLKSPYFVETVTAESVGVSYPAINATDIMQIYIAYPQSTEEQKTIADYLDTETTRIDNIIKAKETLIEHLKEKRTALITHAVTKGLDPNAKMKPSGVEWIGDIPEEWEVKKLKYISAVNQCSLPETTQQDYEFRYVDIGGVTLEDGITEYTQMFFEDAPSRARRVVEKGDTIVSTVRTYLKAIAKIEDADDVIVSTGFAVIRPKKISSDFFSFALKSPYFVETVTAESVGVSYPAINATGIMQIRIPYPQDIVEQQVIANYLDTETKSIDLTITKTQTSIEKLREYRTALISACVMGKLDVRSV